MRAPRPLIAFAVLYLLSELVLLLAQFKVGGVVRLVLYAFVLGLAIRGSRGAAKLWGVLSLLGGAVTAYGALKLGSPSSTGFYTLSLYSVFFFSSAAYIFTSKTLANYLNQCAAKLKNEA
jgi:hypothetical protein